MQSRMKNRHKRASTMRKRMASSVPREERQPVHSPPGSVLVYALDMKLTRRFDESEPGDAIDRVRALFGMLRPLQKGVA